jgi:CheY-like chemotaxis protein
MVTPPIHTVLLVDDNPDDCEIVREAWSEVPIGSEIRFLNDGHELFDYLYRRGRFFPRNRSPRPSVILLDLNMPHLTGAEVIVEIKKDSCLASIPIVILSTSKAPGDIGETARLGVNGYIHKPHSYNGYLQMLTNLRKNWQEILDQSSTGGGGYGSANIAWC